MPKIIWNDLLIGAAIFLNLGAKLLTGYIESSLSSLVQTANVLEANPVQRSISTGSAYIQFLTSAVMYAMLLALYWWFKKDRDKSEYNKLAFAFFTLLVFWGFLADFINDLGPALSLIIK